MKKKIFISSVQSEFSKERRALHEYIYADPLLGKFFEPFLFELLPAVDQKSDNVYMKEVEKCDIYLGLFGKYYGSENSDGISPTELEFVHASHLKKTRFIFISNCADEDREPKEKALIRKAQALVVRRKFASVDNLKAMVYASLICYLEDKEIIRSAPFDSRLEPTAEMNEIDDEKIKSFVRLAQSRRGFPFAETEPKEKILTHLNLLQNGKLTKAAILLFGKRRSVFSLIQRFVARLLLEQSLKSPSLHIKFSRGRHSNWWTRHWSLS